MASKEHLARLGQKNKAKVEVKQEEMIPQPPLNEALTLAEMMLEDEAEVELTLSSGRKATIRRVTPLEIAISPFFQMGLSIKGDKKSSADEKMQKYLSENQGAYEDFLICIHSVSPKICKDADPKKNEFPIEKLSQLNRNLYLQKIGELLGNHRAALPF